MAMAYGTITGLAKPLSRLVQGTVPLSSADEAGSLALLDAVYEHGCRTFDTAHGYGNGDCERVLGRWLKRRGVRDEVVILGKGGHPYDGRNARHPGGHRRDLHESLERMQLDQIDLYVLHRDDPSSAGRADRRGAERAPAGGHDRRVRRLELVDGPPRRRQHLRRRARSGADAGQQPELQPGGAGHAALERLPQHLRPRGRRRAGLVRCERDADLPLVEPGRGLLLRPLPARQSRDLRFSYFDKLCVTSYGSEENFRRLDRAEALGRRAGLSLPQVALAYVMSQPLDVFALVGCRTGDEFAENAAALDQRLTAAELAWLDLSSDERPW